MTFPNISKLFLSKSAQLVGYQVEIHSLHPLTDTKLRRNLEFTKKKVIFFLKISCQKFGNFKNSAYLCRDL